MAERQSSFSDLNILFARSESLLNDRITRSNFFRPSSKHKSSNYTWKAGGLQFLTPLCQNSQ